MPDFIFLMHGDAPTQANGWESYLNGLQVAGVFQGGSAIGDGVCCRKQGVPASMTASVVGFVRVIAIDLDHAKSLLVGNPVYEAGGTVEIRELPRED
ncbi:MAG: hypothetical protein JO258_02255 [Alphaproteobacteria bacterium]|nr:hypothetical protein [Alphaproteobacteria bacterium]